MAAKDYENNPEVAAALAKKYLAEAEKETSLARYQKTVAEMHEMSAEVGRLDHRFHMASDFRHQVYRFTGAVDDNSVAPCIDSLSRWSRLNPGSDIKIVLNSPGGSVVAGFDLYDTILELRNERDHHVTIVARGYAASMASIILQAADHRIMGREAYLLVHEVSAWVGGTLGDIQDRTKWLEMMTERTLGIYADRCASSGAEKPFTKAQIKKAWTRTDWWIDSDTALKGGLVDEVK